MTEHARSAWTDLGGGVQVRRSTLYATNSVVLLDSAHTVVVDPAVLPSEIDDIARVTHGVSAVDLTLVFTHGDWDHVLGRPWWPAAATLGHDHLASELRDRHEAIRAEADRVAAAAEEHWNRPFEPFRPNLAVSGLHFRKLAPWRLVFRDAFGHSASMLSLHLPEQRILIAADMLSDIEIPMIEQSCELYQRTLEALVPIVEGGAIETLIPGHGTIARSRDEVQARLRRDRTYLIQLETQVRAAHAHGRSLEQATAQVDLATCMPEPPTDMDPVHRKNVARVYAELAATHQA